MKTLEEMIMTMLIESGMKKKSEQTKRLARSLNNLFQHEWDTIEYTSRIAELELALAQKNKVYSGGKIIPDLANRNMIDPTMLSVRREGLIRKMGDRHA